MSSHCFPGAVLVAGTSILSVVCVQYRVRSQREGEVREE